MVGTTSGLGGFMSGSSIRFSKLKNGTGGADAWRDGLNKSAQGQGNGSRPRTAGMQLPKVNSIHHATVVCTKEFGAFMQLGDGDTFKDGLLHVSHMGESRFECPEDAGLKVGTRIWVKVMEVKEDDMKYSLDMRYVDQQNGKDLDTYHTKGRLPFNNWNGGKVKAAAAPPPAMSALSQLTGSSVALSSSAGKRKSPPRLLPEDDDDDSDDSDEHDKVRKKIKTARKKVEKLRKKSVKLKKKLEKKIGTAVKKDRNGSRSS